MKSTQRKLLTIITEAALEGSLENDLEKLGAKGYTILDARGSGHNGLRSANWDATKNIRIEVICSEELSGKVINHLKDVYYDNYAMILFVSEVEVLRPEKF